ncbi:LacI family DNA-binding transcriptional regulator [Reinekea thalattae]|uniref:LacI family transcriptional regulator n=1 Tax=Reinekea thalattae TaxID=2593301 RepID=A0A5C8Z1R4_9GAMM|nr:LacI family DNA-binding transcriptional regulator [Reinekea thalattae]TXR52025.1 LacI family transcriptional regulator [Reinekea thalattae]
MTTVYDVAKLANVSAMTVSRALNNPEKVSPQSLKRVQDAIQQLGYQQNQAARALVTKSTGIVKLVMPKRLGMSDPYFTALFAGIASVLSENRLAVLIEDELSSTIKYDGIILTELHDEHSYNELLKLSTPVVLFGKGQRLGEMANQLDWVDLNHFEGAYLATQHLLSLGHTAIALFKFDSNDSSLIEREQGYRKAMAEYGIDVDPNWVVSGLEDTSYAAKSQAIDVLSHSAVTGVVCTSDLLAIGVIQAARELNRKIPQQLSVVGFDGVGYDQMCDPRLTTLCQPVFWIGQRLAQLLIERIQDKTNDLPARHEIISAELVVRDSTAVK